MNSDYFENYQQEMQINCFCDLHISFYKMTHNDYKCNIIDENRLSIPNFSIEKRKYFKKDH